MSGQSRYYRAGRECEHRFAHALPVALAIWLAASAHGQPQALSPVPFPHFAIDAASPTIGKLTPGGTVTAGSVLSRTATDITVLYSPQGLGLQPGDELRDLSVNRAGDIQTPSQTFVILFGVDRQSVGARGPDTTMANRPFNMMDQANRHQAAGDMYMSLDGWNRQGGPLTQGLRVPPYQNNTLVLNQGDSGGVDYALSPNVPPLLNEPPGAPQDDGDGTYYDPGVALVAQDGPGGVQPSSASPTTSTPVPVFFTVSKRSSVPSGLPVPASGANIYVNTDPGTPGGVHVFALADQLCLQSGQAGDEIDGLVVFDQNGNNVFDAGDQILISLSPGSPSLGAAISPADVLTMDGPCSGGTCPCWQMFAHANDLGLLPSDNIDNLELFRVPTTSDPHTTAFNSSIYYVLPGDVDGNGVLNSTDCNQFASCYTGPGGTATGACKVYDMDSDGDVDCYDWQVFRMIYAQETGGQSCLPLSIPQFVNVLLTKSQGLLACMADVNADTRADGRDIQAYIKAILGP